MPKDKIPYWDFDAQGEERDASSAACIASALIELSELDTDIKGSQKYLDYATDILRNLSSPKYLAENYINTGSDYLCSAIFLPLGLPETNRFWKGEPEMWTNKKAWKGIDIGTDHALRDLNK